jgi:hypothetical protein
MCGLLFPKNSTMSGDGRVLVRKFTTQAIADG